jgi:hypothetical protein
MQEQTVPLNLRAALRALRIIPDFQILGEWQLHGDRWGLHCRTRIQPPQSSPIRASTDWYVLVDRSYPWGRIDVFPARVNGITGTFHHQRFNEDVHPDNHPWKTGNICVAQQGFVLGRFGAEPEPMDASGPHCRLAWHVRRTFDWLNAAATDQLVQPGDPFELPVYPIGRLRPTIIFAESTVSFPDWDGISDRRGIVEFSPLPNHADHFVVRRLLSTRGVPLREVDWGGDIAGVTERTKGVWIRVDEIPVRPPWQAPRLWSELTRARPEAHALLRSALAGIRDGESHCLLIGTPIPGRVGGPNEQMHWLAIDLPAVSFGTITLPGFRPNRDAAHFAQDQRTVMQPASSIPWTPSVNWDPSALGSRGHLPSDLTSLHVLLLGAGALGCALSELLMRAGLQRMTIMDKEALQAGNLCRHNLSVQDLDRNKAEALAERLQHAVPHAVVRGIPDDFSSQQRNEVDVADLVIDCTAENRVIHDLSRYPWPCVRRFISVSLGWAAQRLFFYSATASTFPADLFNERLQPWLTQEADRHPVDDFPREEIGCWHPVFPARIDDVWLMAAAAIKELEHTIRAQSEEPRLTVFEQRSAGDTFTGVVRLDHQTPTAHE